MGFYGNITNTSNTTFQFDKIYPNRVSMEANTKYDSIFTGRYVLIEYDQDAAYPVIWTKDQQFYSSPECIDMTRIKFSQGKRPVEQIQSSDVFYSGEIGQVQNLEYDDGGNLIKADIKFYQCTNLSDATDQYATFEELTSVSSLNSYIQNFAIDEKKYGNSKFKGYDSTVWVKTTDIINGKFETKYVNIADLNSVVPTFDIAADAPTMTPIIPHFDADNTNVYYKLHMQTPYGFRVAAADGGPSDEDITWSETTYNKQEDKTETTTTKPFKGAIYYNKAGFDPKKASKTTDTIENNHIELAPTGRSNVEYSHGNETNDIQEFRLHLPAIGNMMSDAWDIIHGSQRDDYRGDTVVDAQGNILRSSSLQGRLDSFEDMNCNAIPVKRIDGTLVASYINGNKFADIPENTILKCDISKDVNAPDPWIYININSTDLDNENNLSGIAIHHDFHETAPIHHDIDMNDDNRYTKPNREDYPDTSEGELEYNAALLLWQRGEDRRSYITLHEAQYDATGHAVGADTRTFKLPYGYKYMNTKGLSNDTNDLYTTNTLDSMGLDYTKEIGHISNTAEASATQDIFTINPYNKWIQIKVTDNESDEISLAHEVHYINSEEHSEINLNQKPVRKDYEEGEIGNQKYLLDLLEWQYYTSGDTIIIPDWLYDSAGHITAKNPRQYTLPYGYKTIVTNGRYNSSNEINTEDFSSSNNASTPRPSLSANSTQAVLALNSGNEWIKIDSTLDGDLDTLTFSHDIHYIDESEQEAIDLNELKADQITVQNTVYDKAGHVTQNQYHAYILPFGFKTIDITNNSNNTASPSQDDAGTETADNTQDTLKLTATNQWIKLGATGNNEIKFGHEIQGEAFGTTYYAKEQEVLNDSNYKQEPQFGETAKILNVTVDNAGHITGFNANTIKIPMGKYESNTPNTNSNSVLVGLALNGPTGEITSQSATTNTLTLADYTYNGEDTDTQTVASGQSINTALGKLEQRINDLDYNDSSANTTQFVSKITQKEGIISVERAAAGTLILGTTSDDNTILSTSSLNDAFNITNERIKNDEDALAKEIQDRKDAIDALTGTKDYSEHFDTMKEIADWLDANKDGVVDITLDIVSNTNAINNETLRAEKAEKEIMDMLTKEIDRSIKDDLEHTQQNTILSSRCDGLENEIKSKLHPVVAVIDVMHNTLADLDRRIRVLEQENNEQKEQIQYLQEQLINPIE